MIFKKVLVCLCLIFLIVNNVYSQNDPAIDKDLDLQINQALDYFSDGDYDKAITLLESVLSIDPENQRAVDLLISIKEIYKLEKDSGNPKSTDSEDFTAQRPDFSVMDPNADPAEELQKPDFSVHDKEDLIRPEETRSKLELDFSPALIFPWNLGKKEGVLPESGSYSVSGSASLDYYFNIWDRIIGLRGGYSLLLFDPVDQGFAGERLHFVDILVTFRTFFKEEVDSKTIFRIGAGYRGYFAGGYDFYSIDSQALHGFNMDVDLEGPLFYLFWDRDGLKKILMGIHMNLLFFPEINTLNFFDFKIDAGLQFQHFYTGLYFGAYSVITTVDSQYIWMAGLSFRFLL